MARSEVRAEMHRVLGVGAFYTPAGYPRMHSTIVASHHALYHYDITPLPGCFAAWPGWIMVAVSEAA